MNEDVATADANRDARPYCDGGCNSVVLIEEGGDGDASAARAALLARLGRQPVVHPGCWSRAILYDGV